MIALAQPFAPAEVVLAALVQAEADIDVLISQQGQQPVGAVVAVRHHHVAAPQLFQQGAEQSRLAGLLALVRPAGAADHAGGGEGEQHHQADHGEAQPLLLGAGLGVFGLVGRGIGSGNFGSVGQQDAPPFPAPVLSGGIFEGGADLIGEASQEGFGELDASLAVGAGVGGAGAQAGGDAEDQDTGDGADTGLGPAEGL